MLAFYKICNDGDDTNNCTVISKILELIGTNDADHQFDAYVSYNACNDHADKIICQMTVCQC